MSILASRLQSQMASALDAGAGVSTGSNRYTFANDYKYAINYAARKLIEWASSHAGSKKFNSEALRELRHVWVFQSSNYSRVEIPATVNTINAVYPEIVTSPTSPSLIGNDTVYTWDTDFIANLLRNSDSFSIAYNGLTETFTTPPSFLTAAEIVTLLSDFFNDPYGLDLDDEFDDYGEIVTAISYSGYVYGDMVFYDMYGEIIATITPTVSYTQLHSWASFKRPDVIFLDAVKDAKRITDEEKAHVRDDPFSPGFEAATRTIKLYAYSEITDFNSSAYTPNPGRTVKEIQIDPDRKRVFVAIALVENYTDIDASTDEVTIPEEFNELMVQLGLIWITYKQQNELLYTASNDLLVKTIQNYGM